MLGVDDGEWMDEGSIEWLCFSVVTIAKIGPHPLLLLWKILLAGKFGVQQLRPK